jgi:hypothetical protein
MLYADPAPEYGLHRGGTWFNKQPERASLSPRLDPASTKPP